MNLKFRKIAAAVPLVHLADVERNKAEIFAALAKASELGAELVVLPAFPLTGATCGDLMSQEILADAARRAEDDVRAFAEALGLRVVIGESDIPEDDNIVVLQDARPEIVTGYRYIRSQLAYESKGRVLVYCSAGYGESTTDGVYSGAAFVMKDGRMLAENERFNRETSLIVADLSEDGEAVPEYVEVPEGRHPFVPDDTDELSIRCREIISIQTVGLMSRLDHIKARKVVIGISGGLDSTLALLVCCNAFDRLGLDRKGVLAVTMPGFGTSGRTHANALKLMEGLGVDAREISIVPSVLQHFKDIDHSIDIQDAVYENSQARERTQILMDMANQQGGIVIGTGDLSEIALGWCTYNGDHMSMYSVNCDVPKTMMQAMTRWAADNIFTDVRQTLIDIVETPISPELTVDQKTEDIVGPYELHDFFLYHFISRNERPSTILQLAVRAYEGIYEPDTVEKWLRTFIRRFFSQQFKRSCSADGPQVGSVCLSPRGPWSMPSDASPELWLSDLD